MRARMDNPIHVEIQIVELLAIGIRSSSIYRKGHTIDLAGMFFDDGGDDFGIFLAEPAEQGCRALELVRVR